MSFEFNKIFVQPLVELWTAITKKRPKGRRNLIILQIISYAMFWMIVGDSGLRYVYMLKTFPHYGFDGESYSRFLLFFSIKDIIALLVIMPILSQIFQIHEALLTAITLILQSLGYFLAPFTTNLWIFYAIHVSFIKRHQNIS